MTKLTLEEFMEAMRLQAIRDEERCGHLPYAEFIRCILKEEDEDD